MNDFTYQIVQGNEEGKFRIDAAAGEVLVNKPLDFDHPVMDRNVSVPMLSYGLLSRRMKLLRGSGADMALCHAMPGLWVLPASGLLRPLPRAPSLDIHPVFFSLSRALPGSLPPPCPPISLPP